MAASDLSIDRFTRSHLNALTSVRLDRLDQRRDDEAWLGETLGSPAARFVPLWRSRNLFAPGKEGQVAVYLQPGELDRLDSIQPPTLLGTDGKRYFFAVSINDAQHEAILSKRPEARFVDLRRASMDMDAKHAGVLAYAKALHYWQHRHVFCGVCGNPNLLRSSGHRLVCSNEECGRQTFPRIDPAIIVLVTHGDACLLGRNAAWPPRRYSTLAGFVEPGESLEDAVVREVFEEARVRLTGMSYVSSQPWPFPASAMCGFYAEAENRHCENTDEMEHVRWFNVEELESMVREGSLRLPPPVSIAFQLIADWYCARSGKNLRQVVAEAKKRAAADPLTFRD